MSGRKRATERMYSAEDQALDQISKEAEERIQARRLARAEAREIRLREIERQQREEEEKQKGSDTPKASLSSYSGSRRGSDDSTGSDLSSKDSRDPKDKVRELKNQLRDMEEKYKQAMVTNAQLDNTKTAHVFQLELLKEQLEEKEETLLEVNREYKDKCRDFDFLKRDFESLTRESEHIKKFMEVKDKLLQDSGFVIVSSEEGELSLTKCTDMAENPVPLEGSLIVSEEAAEILKKTAGGSLGKSDKIIEVDNVRVRDIATDVCDEPEKRQLDDEMNVNEKATPFLPANIKHDINVGKVDHNKNVDNDLDVTHIDETVKHTNKDNTEIEVETKKDDTEQTITEFKTDTSNKNVDENREKKVDDVKEDLPVKAKDQFSSPKLNTGVPPVFNLGLENEDDEQVYDDNSNIRPEIQDMFLKQGLMLDRDRSNIVSSASFISMESDVTYGELEAQCYSGVDEEINALKQEDSGVVSKKDEFDEVFASVTEGTPGVGNDCSDESLKAFARGYVKDIIQKSVDKTAFESMEDKVVIRQQSITAENIDIRIPKRHYSEDLVENVTPFVAQNLPRGSVDILTPLTSLDSAKSADESTKFFSFKLDTEPDVVLQSVDEETEDHVSSTMSSVSGYGVCVVGGVDGNDSPSPDMVLTKPNFSIGSPEFISMSISLESDDEETAVKDHFKTSPLDALEEVEGKYEVDLEKAIESVDTKRKDSGDESDDNAEFEDAVEHVSEMRKSETMDDANTNDKSILPENSQDIKIDVINVNIDKENVEDIDNASIESDDIVEVVENVDNQTDQEGNTDIIHCEVKMEQQEEASESKDSETDKTEKGTVEIESVDQKIDIVKDDNIEKDKEINSENSNTNFGEVLKIEESGITQDTTVDIAGEIDYSHEINKENKALNDVNENIENSGSSQSIEVGNRISITGEDLNETEAKVDTISAEDSGKDNKETSAKSSTTNIEAFETEDTVHCDKDVKLNESDVGDMENRIVESVDPETQSESKNELTMLSVNDSLNEEKSNTNYKLEEGNQGNETNEQTHDDSDIDNNLPTKSGIDNVTNLLKTDCNVVDSKNGDTLENDTEKGANKYDNDSTKDNTDTDLDNVANAESVPEKDETSNSAYIKKFIVSGETDDDSEEENRANMGFTDREIADVLDLLDVETEDTDQAKGAETVKYTENESENANQSGSQSKQIDSGLERPESIGIDSDPPSVDEASAASSETGEASGGMENEKHTDKNVKGKKDADKDRKKKNEKDDKKKKDTPEKVERRHHQDDGRKVSKDEKKKSQDEKKRSSKVEKKRDSHEDKRKEGKEDKKKKDSKGEKGKDGQDENCTIS